MKTLAGIPSTTRLIQASDGRGGVQVITQKTPVPKRGEVLVRMAAAPINPSDINRVQNASRTPRAYPLPAGREGSGLAAASGGGALADFLVGRRIAVSGGDGGTWAEFAVVPATSCVPLRKAISLEQGSMLLVNPLTAYALIERARKDGHKTIVNTAASGSFGEMVRRLGAKRGLRLIDVVRREEQAARLKTAGAGHVLNSADPDFTDQLRSLTHQLDARFLLDAVGGTMTGHLVEGSPPNSTVVLYGNLSQEQPVFSGYTLLRDHKRIEGFFLGQWSREAGLLKLLVSLYRVQRLVPQVIRTRIGRRFLLSEIEPAIAFAQQHASRGKALLVIDPDLVPLKES